VKLAETTHHTDKERAHKYCSGFYDAEFIKYKDKPIKLLEIGIDGGGSIKMWKDYFPQATIYCTDINGNSLRSVEDLGVIAICADAYNADFAKNFTDFDIIIDDGPHTEASQLALLDLYLPKLNAGGVLVIEDILDTASLDKFKLKVPLNCSHEIVDLRSRSGYPESILFIVRK
jgi:cephalosporin hydroxylase